MAITAVLIGLSVLATATLVHDMQTRPISTVDEGYTLQSVSGDIESTGEHVDEWRTTERSLQYRQGYSASITYWEGDNPDHAGITFDGARASLRASEPVKGINAQFIYNTSLPEPDETVKFTDISESSPSQNYDFENTWSVEGVEENSNEEEFEYEFSDAGYYDVELEAETDEGDVDTELRTLRVGSLVSEIASTNSPVRHGEDILEVQITLDNKGADEQDEILEFEVYDEDDDAVVGSDSVDFNLPPRISEDYTFFWDPSSHQPDDSGTDPENGRYEVNVTTPYAEITEPILVLP